MHSAFSFDPCSPVLKTDTAKRIKTGIQTASVLLFKSKMSSEILLFLRDDTPAWTTTGGIVDRNETQAKAALREAKEETGLTITLCAHVGDFWSESSVDNSFKKLKHERMFLAVCTDNDPKPVLGNEGVALRWFDIKQPLPNTLPPHYNFRIDEAYQAWLFYKNHGYTKPQAWDVPSLMHTQQHVKSFRPENIPDFNLWCNHPRVKEKQRLGTLTYTRHLED